MREKPQTRGTDGQFLPTGEDIYQEIPKYLAACSMGFGCSESERRPGWCS